jgi:hypothetical protein
MGNTLIDFKSQEFQNVLQAYNTIGEFIEKYMPVEEIYTQEFIESVNEVKNSNKSDLKSVESFDDFIK